MAGADRVEGCLFGNGERTGNCDLVTVALNMYTQGVDPGLDFSDIDDDRQHGRILQPAADPPAPSLCRRTGLHLVFGQPSGRDQEGLCRAGSRRTIELWEVPYLPIDPADLGRSYEAVIRVNSQSGKGGFAWVLEQDQGLKLPKKMQAHFCQPRAGTGRQRRARAVCR